MNDAPIGIFDSGVGGLTVARAVIDQLPNESIIYVGDTANTPYGPKSIQEARELALNVMDRLVDEGVKVLVIACNSASAAVLRDARERYTAGRGIPVVEVIQPAVRRAVAATRLDNRARGRKVREDAIGHPRGGCVEVVDMAPRRTSAHVEERDLGRRRLVSIRRAHWPPSSAGATAPQTPHPAGHRAWPSRPARIQSSSHCPIRGQPRSRCSAVPVPEARS